MLRSWYRAHRLPESPPCRVMMRDSHHNVYNIRPSFPKPFGFRAASAFTELSIPSVTVYRSRLPRIGFWQLPDVPVCNPVIDCKKDVPPLMSRSFLEHFTSHSDFVPVFTPNLMPE